MFVTVVHVVLVADNGVAVVAGLMFDFIFNVQHFILYPHGRDLKFAAIPSGGTHDDRYNNNNNNNNNNNGTTTTTTYNSNDRNNTATVTAESSALQ